MKSREELLEEHRTIGKELDDLDHQHDAIRKEWARAGFWRFHTRSRLMDEANKIIDRTRELGARAASIHMTIHTMDSEKRRKQVRA